MQCKNNPFHYIIKRFKYRRTTGEVENAQVHTSVVLGDGSTVQCLNGSVVITKNRTERVQLNKKNTISFENVLIVYPTSNHMLSFYTEPYAVKPPSLKTDMVIN